MVSGQSLWKKLRLSMGNLLANVRHLMRARLRDLSDEQRQRTDDALTMAQQLGDILRYEGIAPPPPKHLQMRVVGGFNADFIESGLHICADLDRTLALAGKKLADFGRVLDFGCGCGRNTRALKFVCRKAEVFGSDVDTEAIEWLQAHAQSIGTFAANSPKPPTAFPASHFDFIASISVFTHLPEDMQFEWLSELARIAKPGAYLILSTHGRNHFPLILPAQRADLEKRGFAYEGDYPTDGLPHFYQLAYHTADYIRANWSRYFEVLDIAEQGIAGRQDAVLLRKPN